MGGALPWLAARLMPTRIVIFAKAPVPGAVKTRLIPALGADGAAELAHRMLLGTYEQAASVPDATTEICCAPAPNEPEWQCFLPPQAALLTAQGTGDLGERLTCATRRVIAEGEWVILIGTDCPALTKARLSSACRDLENKDVVIHPTFDGGYALLGLKHFDPSIFADIEWSTSSVARRTIAKVRALGWSIQVGETLRDVDEPEDLRAAGII